MDKAPFLAKFFQDIVVTRIACHHDVICLRSCVNAVQWIRVSPTCRE